jgi:protein-S-isoprenylcysteine O-methyltransferase Ste14
MRPSPLSVAFAWGGAALFAASLLFFLYSYLVVFGRPAASGDWVGPALVNTLLFTVFALHHSALARTGMRDAVRRLAPPYLERALYTWIASLLFLAVCWLWRPVPGVPYRLDGMWWWLGAAVQGTGVLITQFGSTAIDALDLAGVRQVHNARTGSVPPHVPLKTTGIYGLVRHPIYLGWVLLVFGAPTMTGTRLVFAVISSAYLAIAVPWEERGLLDTFGADYRAYQQKVRWRMIPGIY